MDRAQQESVARHAATSGIRLPELWSNPSRAEIAQAFMESGVNAVLIYNEEGVPRYLKRDDFRATPKHDLPRRLNTR